MFWLSPPLPPVSYSRDVAPLLDMRCSGCHGDAGGLSTRTHEGLLTGGNLGKAVAPGNPKGSLLLDFVKGLRGEQRRMPLGGAPLTQAEVNLLARWIQEGAKRDAAVAAGPLISRSITLPRGKALRIGVTATVAGYLVVRLMDPDSGTVLWTDEGSLKSPRERGDIGEPGKPVTWTIRTGGGWPEMVRVDLLWRHAAGPSPPEISVAVVDP